MGTACAALLVLVLLLLLCCSLSCPAPTPTDPAHAESHIVEDEFIVMFDSYLPQDEHGSIIRDAAGSAGWDLLPRTNPARLFPSDFAVIRLTNGSSEELLAHLASGRHIKHVEPQRRYQGQLLAHEHDPLRHTHEADEARPAKEQNFCPQPKGRVQASFSFDDSLPFATGRRLHELSFSAPQQLFADYLWDKMYTGTGVRVAVFDTGLAKHHPAFKNVKERSNWTNENTADDGLGHGTFVAGVIASASDDCPGFAPDAELYIFRVFTAQKVSFTSWFLDAFNYALHKKINVLNLSIGGPDFMDRPFVEKVWELSANNIIVVSAIGNDGPLYGTLNNPADQLDVIGVGGMDLSERVAPFSSRGMTTWELPHGYGRVKPDLITYATSVSATRLHSGCRTLSGTSVASPVVAGAIALLASTVPENKRAAVVNPASIKQVLLEGAEVVPVANVFEQGAGKLNLLRSFELLKQYTPRVSAFPAALDLTDCPYMWPHCAQPLFFGARPITLNVTLLNGMGVAGELLAPPTFQPGKNGAMLQVSFTHSDVLWPWSGFVAVQLRVAPAAANWEGDAEGLIQLTVQSPPGPAERRPRVSSVQVPLRVRIVKPPPRQKRLLWDQFHNLRYPPGYFPRDVLSKQDEPFDWNADHPHTNFRTLFTHIRNEGFFIDLLGEPLTCFDASAYGALLIVDPEEEFFPEEIEKLYADVEQLGLSVGVFADWYNTDVMKKIRFYDENTRQWWTPVTGGANVPALNQLLAPFQVALSDGVFDGKFAIGQPPVPVSFASGSSIARFPAGGLLLSATLHDQAAHVARSEPDVEVSDVAVIGLRPSSAKSQGRLAVYGDSSCLDDAHKQPFCADLVHQLIEFLTAGLMHDSTLPQFTRLSAEFVARGVAVPSRLEGSDLRRFSKVLDQRPVCLAPHFASFNASDQVVVSFDAPHHARPDSANNNNNNNANNNNGGNGPDGKPEQAVWQAPMPLQDWSAYFVPYAILSLAVVALIAIALRSRRDRQANKRMPV